ncbi:uncharacterized protein LY89DRAFT_368817 [Mollisia scopiformis]|uniref:DUF6590 domain-containing protein n=1 Tax=Mollisia scopiformis TaxID=149040 RepID=A0A132B467_MOLSC|nr:uncharacterized protein LY89DRAFT_368817 [Mollisia scopiformis]KUJ07131.1 hypothetical protein LY89DRAFT_368817 [Mollisia scopiformis]
MSSSSRSKHRSKRSSSSQSSSYYPTQWSNWEWDVERSDWKRYRLKAPGEYEFEYEKTATAADPAEPRTPQASLDPIQEGSYSASANYALSTGASAEAITRGLARTTLDASVTVTSVPLRNPTPVGGSDLTHITTINPHTDKEEFDPNYKVHKTFEFKQGRVFKVLWSEPQGTGGQGRGDGSSNPKETYTEGVNKFGEPSFQKVRRFVIIRPLAGHCICLPINTYSRQGVTKNGVHAGDHTIAYSGGKPVYFKGEKAKGLTKKPLKIVAKNPRHKLADTSRLNYAKTYTVEYNVKVWFIGNVHKDSMWHLITDFNQVHPPLGTQGLSEPSPYQDGETSYADGGMEEQPTTYVAPIPTYGAGKSTWATSSHVNDPQTWPQQQQSSTYYSGSHDQPQSSYSSYTAAGTYPTSQPASSYNESRPSRSRGKGKNVQRDDVPAEDIIEGEEREDAYLQPSTDAAPKSYPSSRSASAHSERCPSVLVGRRKGGVETDGIPQDDIYEDSEEEEPVYGKAPYEDAADPAYPSQYDEYGQAGHQDDSYASHEYGPAAQSEVVEDTLQEPDQHHDTTEYQAQAAYEYPAETEEYTQPAHHDEYQEHHEEAHYAEHGEVE